MPSERSGVPPTKGKSESFASKFDSPTVCVTTHGSERKYYLHKRLLADKCPCFAVIFSSKLPTVEVTENAIQLNGYGCTDKALDALVDYVYHGSYEGGVEGVKGTKCKTHANVYVLAERLCMSDLKQEALVNMARELKKSSRSCWASDQLSAGMVIQRISMIYSGTPDGAIIPHEDPETTTKAADGDTALDINGVLDTNEALDASRIPDPDDFLQNPPALAPVGFDLTMADPPPPPPPPPSAIQWPPDKMRNLIAYHASSILSSLKQNPDYLRCLQKDSEFLGDLLVHLPDRSDPLDYDSLS